MIDFYDPHESSSATNFLMGRLPPRPGRFGFEDAAAAPKSKAPGFETDAFLGAIDEVLSVTAASNAEATVCPVIFWNSD